VLTLCVGMILSVRRLYERGGEPRHVRSTKFRLISFAAGIVMAGVVGIIVVRVGAAWIAYAAGSRALENQNFPIAITQYQTAVMLDPGKALYHSSLGAAHFQIFWQTHDTKAAQIALDELQLAIELNPLDGRLPGLLGQAYVNLSSSLPVINFSKDSVNHQRRSLLHAARAAYHRAVELEPFSPFYLLELAKICDELGDRPAAETHVKRAIEVEPNFLPGRQWLATLYLETQRPIEADSEYQKIVECQRRYAGWIKDAMESRFLTVDLATLAAALKREGRKT
ncbi:MAG: tetratricopeptide repeat protein, partial [Nitrospiraceae bacterium]